RPTTSRISRIWRNRCWGFMSAAKTVGSPFHVKQPYEISRRGNMAKSRTIGLLLASAAAASLFAQAGRAEDFNIPGGELKAALNLYTKQTGVVLMYPGDEIAGIHTEGAKGDLLPDTALSRILRNTGFT